VAAVEFVGPRNKDLAEHRRAFVTKCAALLQGRASVVVVDLVTDRPANLYRDLIEAFGRPCGSKDPLSACAIRPVERESADPLNGGRPHGRYARRKPGTC
jgi:hypothetical protein